jgi:N-acyl-D-amino-acid deacylase
VHELVIKGGVVVDGTGVAPVTADVAITDGRITQVGRVASASARRVLNVDGAVVSPGFIDLHSHADYSVFGAPEAVSQTHQGVTTLVTGNCGFSPFPVVPEHAEEIRGNRALGGDGLTWEWQTAGEFMDAVDRLPLGVNIACLVGHGALRIAAMGSERRPASCTELDRMRALLRQSIADGVVGLSSGLIYAPGSFAPAEELVELCGEVAARGLLYSTHMRDEGDGLLAAVDEAIATARTAGARLQISHLKAIGPANWGAVHQALDAIEAAAADGVDVAVDQYPYTASSTTLTSRLPGWALDGGVAELVRRLDDPSTAERIAAEVAERVGRTFLPEGVVVADTPEGPYSGFVGRSIADIATEWDVDPARAVVELLRGQRGVVAIVNHAMAEDDVRAVLRHPRVAVASDGHVLAAQGTEMPHPRSFGTYARVLGHYTREHGVLDLPEAIRKMTALPAARLGWNDRGLLRVGAVADVCVFDPEAVTDRATFERPWQLATGVVHTVLAGELALADGRPTDTRSGRVLRQRRRS